MNASHQITEFVLKYDDLPKISIVDAKKKYFKRELKKLSELEIFQLLDYFEFLEKHIGPGERDKELHRIVQEFANKKKSSKINQ